ncbi:uncharacterized protein LOC128325762 isoform X3 [Hemicordylus capensis]|uniref:uncharacterized protein LOC128325762 isoform X3 n=1 Tax=Hemicordylus capensis TaxID=884348 RepID=UPI002303D634|nr:uncharacterized protein LOC128325762 isoform X3 [Hemicordylus capensis]
MVRDQPSTGGSLPCRSGVLPKWDQSNLSTEDPTASCKQPHADEETLRTVIMVSQDKDTLYGTWNGPSGSTNGPSGSTNEWVPPEDVDPTASCKQPHADEETLRTVIMVSQDPTASCKQPHADEETLRTVIMVSQDPTASCKQPHADEETLRTVIMVSQDKDTLYLGPSGSTNGPSGSTNEWVPPEDVGKILGSVQAATGALDPCPSWRVKSARERTGRWLEPIINERARCH